MKCKLVTPIQAGRHNPEPYGTWLPIGRIIDLPTVFRLVQMGVAVPADEECRIRADRTEAQMAEAQRRYPAIAKGITPQDRKAFFAGEMDGYNPDGSSIPGPNAAQVDDDNDNEEEDDDDE